MSNITPSLRQTWRKGEPLFQLQHTDAGSAARAGRITTDHGTIETPIFMPVGTGSCGRSAQLQWFSQTNAHR